MGKMELCYVQWDQAHLDQSDKCVTLDGPIVPARQRIWTNLVDNIKALIIGKTIKY